MLANLCSHGGRSSNRNHDLNKSSYNHFESPLPKGLQGFNYGEDNVSGCPSMSENEEMNFVK